MKYMTEATKIAAEILGSHPWWPSARKAYDVQLIKGEIVIQRLIDEKDAEIERLKQQLANNSAGEQPIVPNDQSTL